MYYLYHIPGKKIGVTRDLNTRVTLIQAIALVNMKFLISRTI